MRFYVSSRSRSPPGAFARYSPRGRTVSFEPLEEGALLLALAANTCTAHAVPTACQPSWLDTGSNGWQLTAATFVALMSIPGLALLYGGLVPKKWVVNTMFMAFSGFATVLVVWVLWAYKMGFGSPIGGGSANTYHYTYGGNFFKNFFYNFVGHPETSLKGTAQTSQATLPIGTPRGSVTVTMLPAKSNVWLVVSVVLMRLTESYHRWVMDVALPRVV